LLPSSNPPLVLRLPADAMKLLSTDDSFPVVVLLVVMLPLVFGVIVVPATPLAKNSSVPIADDSVMNMVNSAKKMIFPPF
jgi:hypothetical protein